MPTDHVPGKASPPGSLSPRLLAGLFGLALLPRLVLGLVYLDLPLGLDDMFQYDMLGRSIAGGQGYRWYSRADVAAIRPYIEKWYPIDLPPGDIPENGYLTTFRAPGYPIFLAAIYSLTGPAARLAAVRLVQVLLGAALAPLTALLAARLLKSPRAPLLAGVVVALYPILWMYPIGLGSENLFIPLTLLGALALLDAARSSRPGAAAASGVWMGAAALTRGAFAATIPLALIWLWTRAGWRRAALAGVVAMAVLLPWSIRNSLILGRPAFVESTLGYNLFVGYHPEGDGGFITRIALIPVAILDDGERDRWTTQNAADFIAGDPARAALLALPRLAYFWGWETREMVYFYSNNAFGPVAPTWLAAALIALVAPWMAVALTAPLGWATAPDTRGRGLAIAFVVGGMLPYVAVLAEPRFHLPLLPWLAAYAAQAASEPRAWLSPPAHRRAARAAAVLVMLLLVLLWSWDALRLMPRWLAVLAPGGHELYLVY
jgi:4-amino-4-deoxy-L-arabinose transferase-like glycosyltransferase